MTNQKCVRKLITRWLWNADAIHQWEQQQGLQAVEVPSLPEWWSQRREDEDKRQNKLAQQAQHNGTGGAQSKTYQRRRFDGYISQFSGQGREIGYNGLTYSVLLNVYEADEGSRPMQSIQSMIRDVRKSLQNHRAGSWWVLSLVSLALVWLDIGMAIMISYNTPTVGLGCRSGSFILYGCLSTLTWLLHLLPWFRQPGRWSKALCHIICLLSTLSLGFVIFAAVRRSFPSTLVDYNTNGQL